MCVRVRERERGRGRERRGERELQRDEARAARCVIREATTRMRAKQT